MTVTIPVRAVPKAQRDVVAGVTTDDAGRAEVVVRVTAAPEGGKANKAVCAAVAKSLGVAKGCVRVTRGETSRHKMVEVSADDDAVATWVGSLPRL